MTCRSASETMSSRGSHRLSLIGIVLLVCVALLRAAFGQEPQSNGPERTKILDLVFRVEDIGSKIQDLEVKETGQEVRIELAADVLFDFDKADLRPTAQTTLHQAA